MAPTHSEEFKCEEVRIALTSGLTRRQSHSFAHCPRPNGGQRAHYLPTPLMLF